MTQQTYQDGYHAALFPASAEFLQGDADWEQGFADARELAAQVRAQPTYTVKLTDDGLVDMFIMGPDGIPLARINEPVTSGEEALTMAREWQEPQQEVEQE